MLFTYRDAVVGNSKLTIFTDSQPSDWLRPPFAPFPTFHVQYSMSVQTVLFLPLTAYLVHFDEVFAGNKDY